MSSTPPFRRAAADPGALDRALAELTRGTSITLELTDGRQVSGELGETDGDSVVVNGSSGRVSVPRRDVARLLLPRVSSRGPE